MYHGVNLWCLSWNSLRELVPFRGCCSPSSLDHKLTNSHGNDCVGRTRSCFLHGMISNTCTASKLKVIGNANTNLCFLQIFHHFIDKKKQYNWYHTSQPEVMKIAIKHVIATLGTNFRMMSQVRRSLNFHLKCLYQCSCLEEENIQTST